MSILPGSPWLLNPPLFPEKRDGGADVTGRVMGSSGRPCGWLEVLDGEGSSRAAEHERLMEPSPAV